MFRFDKILDGQKEFKREGVGITTNGVPTLVHFILCQNKEVSAEEVSDDEENLLSMDWLSLTLMDNNADNDLNDGGMENILLMDQLSLTPVDNNDIDDLNDGGKQRYFTMTFLHKLFTHFNQSDIWMVVSAEHRHNTVELSTNPWLRNLLTVQMYMNGHYKKTSTLPGNNIINIRGSTTQPRHGWAG